MKCSATVFRIFSGSSPRAAATRFTWNSAASGEMKDSRPLPDAKSRSAGTGVPCGRPWAFSSAALRSATVFTSSAEVQERLLAPEGMVA